MVVHDQWSLHLPLKVNPWKFNDRPYQQVTTMPGARYWFIDAYSRGWFLGVNAVVSMYNHRGLVGNHMDYFARDYHYKGFGYGAGVSGGYSFPIGKRWNFEVEFGIAGMYLDHDIYDDVNERGRIGYQTGFQPVPGKIAASIVYLF